MGPITSPTNRTSPVDQPVQSQLGVLDGALIVRARAVIHVQPRAPQLSERLGDLHIQHVERGGLSCHVAPQPSGTAPRQRR